MQDLIEHLEGGQNLNERQIATAAKFLLGEESSVELKKGFLNALTSKGESVSELTVFVKEFLKFANKPDFSQVIDLNEAIDVCGTGGDKLNLFNVSTTSMFVVAAAGGKVIKHGNRGITSNSGGADVLEALGVPLSPSIEQSKKALETAGVCFLFAQNHHPAFKAVAPVRAALAKEGKRTLFNLIGPLLNPANPANQLVGVTESSRVSDFADILENLGRKSVFAVHGETQEGEPVDELSNMGGSRIEIRGTQQTAQTIKFQPADFNLNLARKESMQGASPEENAKTLYAILDGQITDARLEIVLLNSAATLWCLGKVANLEEGIMLAKEQVRSDSALNALKSFQNVFA